ncbi:hypothetical protein GRI97_14130 [Altererythrobacter xixiisoli]|uniref:Gamma-glutamylcyclotransferase AIG2-like domain-containing protein n=1 Tax=Croceibacterium xixiisoli TaxID=1476466 RepID=A0A6I4TVN9_9SPHN|nr:gamma-glutamylcyclotransferase family protein [Croceibacterium xixiisoli]MXP00127.1 hypothetical protein [Croceibacterium xixiisoli]
MKLFFYGVLMEHLAGRDVCDMLVGIGPGLPAWACGTLYAVPDPQGWYPALLPGTGRVQGMLHDAETVDLAALDHFEGVNTHDPLTGDYRRAEIEAKTAVGARLRVQAYLWNHAVGKNLIRLPAGDFSSWLKQMRRRPFGDV